jgi:hypothetical protein
MRPGQIRVFDGLRITTEHVNHFQASLHSAIHDIREILGLGMVYAGFDVAATDAQTITVQPGLAFDLQKNRIVSDEPQALEVSFEQNQDTAFVCAKYDQVEGGETEGRSTLIWDGCSLVVRPTLPTEADNLLVLARVTRAPDGTLAVTDLTHGDPAQDPTTEEVPDAETKPTSAALIVKQGVLRLTSAPQGYPGSSIAELVRSAPGGIVGSGRDLAVTLTSAQVPVSFPVASLSCHVLTSVRLSLAEVETTTMRSVATAEATCSANSVWQYGVSLIGSPTAELTEDALARMPLGAGSNAAEGTSEPGVKDVLSRLALVVRVERSNSGLSVVCNLAWTNVTTEELLRQLDAFRPGLAWSNQVAWKALGQM